MRIYLCFGLLLSMLWSCSVVEIQKVQPEPQPDPALVTFTLAMQQANSTKADDNEWDGIDYDTMVGTAYENNIITTSVKVFAYYVSGDAVQFISEIPILQWSKTNDGLAQFQGYFMPQSTGDYRFIVIANCTDRSYGLAYDYAANIPALARLVFDAPSLQEINDMISAIPMYGITTVSVSNTETDIDLGTVWMLRSLAKVELKLSDELKAEGYTIESASISRSNTGGYSLPEGWYSIDKTQNIVHDKAFRPYSDGGVVTDATMIEDDNNYYYLYLPEIQNSSDTPVAINLAVHKNGSLFKEYKAGISFCDYGEDGLATSDIFDIVRNHVYRFTVTGLTQPTELELIITINPWNYRDVTYDNTPLT